jgi:hypothetical protein
MKIDKEAILRRLKAEIEYNRNALQGVYNERQVKFVNGKIFAYQNVINQIENGEYDA